MRYEEMQILGCFDTHSHTLSKTRIFDSQARNTESPLLVAAVNRAVVSVVNSFFSKPKLDNESTVSMFVLLI